MMPHIVDYIAIPIANGYILVKAKDEYNTPFKDLLCFKSLKSIATYLETIHSQGGTDYHLIIK